MNKSKVLRPYKYMRKGHGHYVIRDRATNKQIGALMGAKGCFRLYLPGMTKQFATKKEAQRSFRNWYYN